jgi:hypothetical protein
MNTIQKQPSEEFKILQALRRIRKTIHRKTAEDSIFKISGFKLFEELQPYQ